MTPSSCCSCSHLWQSPCFWGRQDPAEPGPAQTFVAFVPAPVGGHCCARCRQGCCMCGPGVGFKTRSQGSKQMLHPLSGLLRAPMHRPHAKAASKAEDGMQAGRHSRVLPRLGRGRAAACIHRKPLLPIPGRSAPCKLQGLQGSTGSSLICLHSQTPICLSSFVSPSPPATRAMASTHTGLGAATEKGA